MANLLSLSNMSVDEAMDGAFARFSQNTRDLLHAQRHYILDSIGGAPRGTAGRLILANIVPDNSGSMEDLYEDLIFSLNTAVVQALKKSGAAAKIEILIDLLNKNPSYIRQVTGGASSMSWGPVLDYDSLFVNSPDFLAGSHYDFSTGGTPLRQRMVESFASGLVRDHLLSGKPHNRQTTNIYLFMTDSDSTERTSRCVQVDQLRQLMAELPKNHRAHLWGFENGTDFAQVGRDYGFQSDRIRLCPMDGEQLAHELGVFSQSSIAGADVSAVQREVVVIDDAPAGNEGEDLFSDDKLSLTSSDFANSDSDDDTIHPFGDWMKQSDDA